MATGLGLSQLATRSPFALPIGTRPKAIAPTTVPRADGADALALDRTARVRDEGHPLGLATERRVTGEEEIASEG